jgi:ATP-dependent DNA helicase DinG
MSQDVAKLLSAEGPLAQKIPAFRTRPQQQAMAAAIEAAISEQHHLIVEAGTGTGKTFAYLLPSFLSGRKAIISTGTRNLQDQLFLKDVPILINNLELDIHVALLKGRGNYLCLHRMDKQLASGRLRNVEQVSYLQQIREWSSQTIKGDIAELSNIPESDMIWPTVTSTADNCLGTECKHFDQCHVMAARADAQAADVVIVNHHLFCADLALKQEGINDLLPACDVIIFDEAHQLADTATRFFGESISGRQIRELCVDTSDTVEQDAHDELGQITPILDGIQRLTTQVQFALKQSNDRGAWKDIANQQQVSEQLEKLDIELEKLEAKLKSTAARSKDLEQLHGRNQDIRLRLARVQTTSTEFVSWYEAHKKNFVFHRSPLDISHVFNDLFESGQHSCILTSATLTVEKSFKFFQQRIGLENAQCKLWSSPFDYPSHALLYLPAGMPEPAHPRFNEKLVAQSMQLMELAKGRTLMLFTSHRALNECAEMLEDDGRWNVLVQGQHSKRELLDRFCKEPNSVLLGAASFWEGVDIAGTALSCVVIDRLPFASPGDPVMAARIEKLRQEGKEPFKQLQLPQAVIALIQGAGRLIRTETDRGALMIGDPRIESKPYGRLFLRSLPRMPIYRSLDQVDSFFQPSEEAEIVN